MARLILNRKLDYYARSEKEVIFRGNLITRMSSDSSLVCWCTLIGCALSAFSVGGIALSLFLIFEDNVFYDAQLIQGTYTPSEEDVGK